MNVAVLGAGAWGTALAKVLAENGHAVTLWTRDSAALTEIGRSRRNARYLPGVELPQSWTLESDLPKAAHDRDCIVVAIASSGFRELATQLSDTRSILVSVTKGSEYETA